jgi:hypothetical protein
MIWVIFGLTVAAILLAVGTYQLLCRTSDFASLMDGRTGKWGVLSSGILVGTIIGLIPGFLTFHMSGEVWAGAIANLATAFAVGYGWYRLDCLADESGSDRF